MSISLILLLVFLIVFLIGFIYIEPIICEYENYIKYNKQALETSDEKEKLELQNKSISSYAETNRLITSLASMITYEKV